MATAFQTAYSQLNPDQRRAVDQLDGPVMVIAGPGTGKTQVMAVRIGKLLSETDTQPRAVLALTFTDSASKNLRQRLVDLIGTTAYQVPIHTFHSFAATVIQDCPEFFPFNRDSQPLTELEKYQIISDIITRNDFQALKPLNAPDLYVRELNSALSNLKREGISPHDLEKLVAAEHSLFLQEESTLSKSEHARRSKRLLKQSELVTVYTEYQQALQQRSQYDFEDMIVSVKNAFMNESELLSEYQERFLYFLVDEYQDTNSAQNAIVDALSSYWGDEANIFVVGDPHQAIYRFQGASVENMLGFVQRYPTAEVITLSQGYRAPQPVYAAAAALIANNRIPTLSATTPELQQQLAELWQSATQPLVAVSGESQPVTKAEVPSQTHEYIYVAEQIRALLNQDVQPGQIGILYRHNADAAGLVPILEQFDIPFAIEGGADILKLPVLQQWQLLLEVIHAWQDGTADQRLYEVLQQPWWEISPVLLMKIARAAYKSRHDWWTVLHEIESVSKWEPLLTPLELQPVVSILDSFQRWSTASLTMPLTAWLRLVLSESGIGNWIAAQPNRIQLLTAMNTWLTQVEGWGQRQTRFGLGDALAALQLMVDRSIPLIQESSTANEATITLATAHKAKGREWEYVFILHCIDGKWGNNFSRELLPLPTGILQFSTGTDQGVEDERRLFYVALTRAKKQVILCVPHSIVSENRSKQTVPSQFVTEVAPFTFPDTSVALETAQTYQVEQLLALISPPPARKWEVEERRYLQNLANNFTLSVSALNKYLESPELFVEQYLLRIPSVVEPQLAFGTAVHKALEVWEKQWLERGEQPAYQILEDTFVSTLQSEPLDRAELERRLAYGKGVLQQFYIQLQAQTQPPLFVERVFGSGWNQAQLGDVKLTGRIDRVDWLDQSEKTATVIDYKTGRAKTPGQMYASDKASFAELSPREQALPESIRGRYQRQLLFYALLTRLDTTFKPRVTQGTFVFVEPDKETGKFTTRSMEITDSALADLQALIKEVMQEIRSLAFLPTSSSAE